MNEPQKNLSDITLHEDGTASFVLNADGEYSGTCRGLFKFKCFLTPLEQLGASRDYISLVGQHPELLSEGEKWIAWCIAQLKYRIIKAPPFWKTGEAFDGNVDSNILMTVADHAIESQMLYKRRLDERKQKALETAAEALKAQQERLNPIPNSTSDQK